MTGSIQCIELSVSRGSYFALRKINFHHTEGLLPIFGPNGSGKTTLLRALAGLLDIDEGTVLLDDSPINRFSAAERSKSGLLYLPQTPVWVPDLSPLAYLECSMRHSKSKDLLALAEQYRFPANVLAKLLAVSQIQALPVMARRALDLFRSADPCAGVVLLDEPLAGFDPEHYELMFGYIQTLASCKTVLLVEHSAAFREWAIERESPALYLKDGAQVQSVEVSL